MEFKAGGTCAKDTGGTCSSCSLTGQKIEEVKYWYKWPIARGEEIDIKTKVQIK